MTYREFISCLVLCTSLISNVKHIYVNLVIKQTMNRMLLQLAGWKSISLENDILFHITLEVKKKRGGGDG